MPAVVVAIVTYAAAETVGAAIVSTIAAEVVVSTAVATAVGAAAISGTVAAIQGGSASEVLKAAVLGGASSYVGAYVGNVVGAEVGAITGSPVATVIATNAAKNVTAAAITGRDLGTAALTGLAAGVPLMLGNLDAFAGLPEFAKNAISNATIAAVTGKDVGAAVVASALQSANILGSAINSNDTTRAFFADPENKSAVTLVSNAFNYSMGAAIQGRDVSKALEQSLVQSMAQIVGSDANKNLKQYTKNAQDAYKTAQAQEQSMLAASTREASAITTYNNLNTPLREKYENQEALVADFNTKKAAWQSLVDAGDNEGANAAVGGVNAAAAEANKAVEDLNTYYNANKDKIDSAKAEFDSANSDVKAASETYNASLATLKDASSTLDVQVNEFQKYVDAETAKTVDPYETSKEEARQYFQAQGYTPTEDELNRYIGMNVEAETGQKIEQAFDPLAVTSSEAGEAFAKEGYTPLQEQINEYLGNRNETETLAALRARYDPLATMSDEALEFFKTEGYVPSDQELKQYVGNKAEVDAARDIATYADPRAVIEEEVKGAFQKEGYTPEQELIREYIGNRSEEETLAALRAKYDPLATMADEAAEFFQKEGYIPSDQELQQYVGNKAETDTSRDIATYADPRAVMEDEALSAFGKEGYNATQDQIREYLGNRAEADTIAEIRAKYDPLATMADEAAEFFKTEGYVPTAEELQQYVGNKAEVDAAREVSAYADPRAVTEAEARAQYLSQGIPDPTRKELDDYIQQRTETEVLGELDQYADPLGTTAQEAQAFAVKYNLNPGSISDLALLTSGRTSELGSEEALGEYKNALGAADPEYYGAQDRAYRYALDQGKTPEEARAFADEYARTSMGRGVESTEAPDLRRDIGEVMFGGEPGSEGYNTPPGTRLASMDEVMADQASGAGKTYYDANVNAWVTGVAPDVEGLEPRKAMTPKDLASYESGDGNFRIPNPDGSYHMYTRLGVYMGIYTGNDSYVDYRPELAPFDVEPDFSDYPIQNFGDGVEVDMDSFNDSMKQMMEERGGFPVGWQTSGSDRIFIYDDGTGIGMNENGDPYALSEEDVTKMVDNGQLNTAASGYEFGSDTAGTSASTKYKNVPGANIPSFRMVNTPGGTPSFTDPAPRSSTSSSAPASSTSPSASAPSSALKSASETAQGSTLGKIPGSWVGGLGRPSAFIDPLSATKHLITGQEGSENMYSTSPLAGTTGAQRREEEMSLQPEANYYSYGYEPSYSSIMQPYKNPALPDTLYARGGEVEPSPLMTAREGEVPHKGSHYVQGAGGGQDDLIDAKLADGEYVFDAEIVASLGDGSNKRGAEILDDWRENIRKHKRSASVKGIPPKAKSPLEYMKGIA